MFSFRNAKLRIKKKKERKKEKKKLIRIFQFLESVGKGQTNIFLLGLILPVFCSIGVLAFKASCTSAISFCCCFCTSTLGFINGMSLSLPFGTTALEFVTDDVVFLADFGLDVDPNRNPFFMPPNEDVGAVSLVFDALSFCYMNKPSYKGRLIWWSTFSDIKEA